jgi:hypothetical protein
MKNLGKLATLGAILATSASFAFGSSIQLASYGQAGLSGYDPITATSPNTLSNGAMTFVGSATNSVFASIAPQSTVAGDGTSLSSLAGWSTTGAGTAFELDPGGVWTNAPTPPASAYVGSTATSGPVGTVNPTYGYYEYQTVIAPLAFTYTGTITVLADDTTEVLLGNTVIIPFGTIGGDQHCADGLPDCITLDTVALTLPAGSNTLTFVVEQAGNSPTGGPGLTGNPSGVAFDATLNVIPEPSSLMLLGTGLLSAGGMLMRRRRVTA